MNIETGEHFYEKDLFETVKFNLNCTSDGTF